MKHKNIKVIIVLAMLAVCSGCLPFAQGKLYQYSTINALMIGVYEGNLSVHEAKMHGNFGLGTFNHLDGEMIILDGVMYQVPYDGKVKVVHDGMCIPFINISFFHADEEIQIPEGLDYKGFQTFLNSKLPSKNLFYAIRVDGAFSTMKTRSVPRQEPPFRPLTEVVKEQSEFSFESVEGTLIGYWMPEYVQGVGVPAYHLHFITSDKTAGGHVLDFTTNECTMLLDRLHGFDMELPLEQSFLDSPLSWNASEDLESVEKPK